MNGKWILMGFAVAGLAFGAAQPADAQQSSFEVDTECELDFLELLPGDLANVPEDKRNSFFTPVNEGDFAVRKCTQSRPNQQSQQLTCRRVFTDWGDGLVTEFTAKNFRNPCQMVSCDETEFVDAKGQTLKVRAMGPNTAEVTLTCQLNNSK